MRAERGFSVRIPVCQQGLAGVHEDGVDDGPHRRRVVNDPALENGVKRLDIRRHTMRRKPGHHLSQEGLDLARKVGATLGPYAAILTSDLPRAIETAVAMGFAVGGTSRELAEHPETLPDRIGWPAPLESMRAALGAFADVAEAASQQVSVWSRFAAGIPDHASGLIITHGALLEIGTIRLLENLGMAVVGPPFAYCEGIRICLDGAVVGKVEQMRLPADLRLVSN